MTEDDVIIRTRQRMGLPASAGPRILTLIAPALEKTARSAANDVTKRNLLVTDKASVFGTVAAMNFENYVDIAALITSNGIMLDYLEYGTIYYSPGFSGAFTTNDKADFLIKAANGFKTGLQVQLSTSGILPSPFALLTDYFVSPRVPVSSDNFYLTATRDAAYAGTSIIDITDPGTGTHTITPWEQEVVQFSNKEFGNLTNAVPIDYVFCWLNGSKLFTNVKSGVFSFAVPFIPTLATLPAKLDHDLIDAIVELYRLQAEIGADSK